MPLTGKSKVDHWKSEVRRAWGCFVATPAWLKFCMTAGVGAMLAVFLGWVDTHGDAIKIYLALVSLIVAGGASFVTGRVINEHADARAVRRKLQSARFKIQMLVHALTELRRG